MITFAYPNNYKIKLKMDIVTRLKQFMVALNIANSQFADTCRIPRPTISQILNGRNKKISDELISKIHEAYPQLSVLWLMFGEGDMIVGSNIKISEPKIGDNVSFNSVQNSDDESIMRSFDFDAPLLENQQENISVNIPQQNSVQKVEYRESDKVAISKNNPMLINATSKRVIEIRVFYDDNSYEIFVPQKK